MSRIGKKPVPVPSNVTATISGQTVKMKGPKGELAFTVPDALKVQRTDEGIDISLLEDTKPARSKWGMSRTQVANLIKGVTEGYHQDLEIHGVGFKASMKGKDTLTLSVGYSHDVVLKIPAGVEVKEKLKAMRASIDVLTMTATPIPRTLHMSLLGLRDISNLETPPEDRIAVETRVTRFDEELIRHGILRELNRNGQAFFVHNRVNDIHLLATKLQRIVPEARIRIGHGQMPEGELEEVMYDFVNHKFDILLATTIVERLISTAPTDIGSTNPNGASTPAASGTESRLYPAAHQRFCVILR